MLLECQHLRRLCEFIGTTRIRRLSSYFFFILRRSDISVITVAKEVITLRFVTADVTIRSIRHRLLDENDRLAFAGRRLVYPAGPYKMTPLPDEETLGGAGVKKLAHGFPTLQVVLPKLTRETADKLGKEVRCLFP
jgi:hypothetical protein